MKTNLVDRETFKKIPTKVAKLFTGIGVAPEGYATVHDDYPVLVELHEGQVRVLVWGDINNEDPTHIISLEGAKVSNKKKVNVPKQRKANKAMKIELMKFYDAEHGSWYLENAEDFYFETSLPEGDLRGLFYMDDGVVKFGGFEFTNDKFFVPLTNEVSKDVCKDLQSKWLPVATKTLKAVSRRDGI